MKVNKVVLKFVTMGITMIVALLVVYGTVNISLTAFDFGYRVFTEPAMEEAPGTDVAVTIDSTMGGSDIGKELEAKGLVRDGNLFFIQLELSAYKDKIQPGTYILNTSMTARDMMMAMSAVADTEDVSEETEETESTETEEATDTETTENED